MDYGYAQSSSQRYDVALDAFENAARRFAAEGDEVARAQAWLEQGIVLARSGAIDRGERLFRQALDAFEAVGAASHAAHAHLQLAAVQRLRGDQTAITDHLEAAITLYRSAEDESGLAKVDLKKSTFAAGKGDYPATIHHARRAAETFARLGEDAEHADALRNLAYGLQHAGRLEEARAIYDQVLEVAWRLNAQGLIYNVYCNRAEIDRQRGDTGAAEDDLRAAIASFEEVHATSPATPREKAVALAEQVAAYDRLTGLLVDTGRIDEAFEVTERFRARSFTAQLSARALDRAAHAVPELRARERRLLAELGAARLAIETDDSARLRQRVDTLRHDLDALRVEMGGRYRRLVSPPPITTAEIRAQIGVDEVWIAYWISTERTWAWVLSRERTRLVTLPIRAALLCDTVRAYLEPFRSRERAEHLALTGGEAAHRDLGTTLHRWLIKSLPVEAREASRLVFLPDGVLSYLPFESLIVGCDEADESGHPDDTLYAPYRACRFLGLEQSVVYGSSAASVVALRKRRDTTGTIDSLLALAPIFDDPSTTGWRLPPLDASRAEIEGLREHFPNARVLTGRAATERRFKDDASQRRLLHLATHGVIDDRLPLSSGVLLAAGDGEDGLLSAYEVFGLDLDAHLVAMATCRGAAGELSRGEGITGLSRAFLYAGAASVLVSHWDVDDRASASLMTHFYRGLASGLDRAEALRRARRHLFEQVRDQALVFRSRPTALAHPRYWAGFVLIGDHGPGIRPGTDGQL